MKKGDVGATGLASVTLIPQSSATSVVNLQLQAQLGHLTDCRPISNHPGTARSQTQTQEDPG